MPLPVPVESWTEIFKWLEGPKQIWNISLVNRRFHEIIFSNLAKKYEKEEHWKRAPDLRFSREWGAAALREQNEPNRRLPIAEVPPPHYIKPFARVFVHHFDDQVLTFFNAIGQWLQNDILLNVKFRPLNAPYQPYPETLKQLMRTIDFSKFQMFARQILLGHCFGLDNGELNADSSVSPQPIGYLLDEEFVLSIPRIRGIAFEDSFMLRWLFTPTLDGAQRIWILWSLCPEMKRQIEQEFANATVVQKFTMVFWTLHHRDGSHLRWISHNRNGQQQRWKFTSRINSLRIIKISKIETHYSQRLMRISMHFKKFRDIFNFAFNTQ